MTRHLGLNCDNQIVRTELHDQLLEGNLTYLIVCLADLVKKIKVG